MAIKKTRRPKSKNYFTQDTEDAIVLYNGTSDTDVKSKIYQDHIHYPFFKLTENIIHTFKFYYTEVDEIEHLQHEVICFLLSKIHLFDPTRGAKAYSYFGTIAKRYLILQNQKKRDAQVVALISELKPLVQEIGDATLIVPLIKEYMEIGVKNDDALIKMATIVQRALQNQNDDGGLGITDEEKQQLLAEMDKLQLDKKG